MFISFCGSCPESLVVLGQARLFGVAGLNPSGDVSTLLSDSKILMLFKHTHTHAHTHTHTQIHIHSYRY